MLKPLHATITHTLKPAVTISQLMSISFSVLFVAFSFKISHALVGKLIGKKGNNINAMKKEGIVEVFVESDGPEQRPNVVLIDYEKLVIMCSNF
jgi:hypothetical protein